MENFVTCKKRMRAVDGKQEIYLEWPYYAPINVESDVFVECGMWETFRFSSGCHNSSGESVLIQFHYFCTPQKANVGMYSRCLCLTNLVCILFDPQCHP